MAQVTNSSAFLTVRNPNTHQCNCDGCGRQWPEGKRYRCAICDDYDLCDRCYANNLHDLSHPFHRINRPGLTPVRLGPRSPSASPIHSSPPHSDPRHSRYACSTPVVVTLTSELSQADLAAGRVSDFKNEETAFAQRDGLVRVLVH